MIFLAIQGAAMSSPNR